ncbi:MAG: 3-methyladenine DNA glycosylase/8-oxoguanine DNA glycosylase [Polyangiales bacterium]|jgi:3-methyladenine DNA glycosylase/8-oxoguanine DNA glycosylase
MAQSLRLERDASLIEKIPFPFLGMGDPTTQRDGPRVLHASWTPEGAATLCFEPEPSAIGVSAYGDGASYALNHAAALLGDTDDGAWSKDTPLERAVKRGGGAPMTRALSLADVALRVVFGQRVTSREAFAGYRALVKAHGEPAPGPYDLMLPPRGRTLARLPYYELHRFGVERKRALIMQMVGKREKYLEDCRELPFDEMEARLQKLPGIGVWTTGCIRAEFGDADAVQVGDYHLPNLVAWGLAREERGDDERMLELLQPYAGSRQRVIRVLQRAVGHAPRRGPKNAPSKWTRDGRY